MSVANWIGRRAAEVVAFFRDKPFVPCQVDWDRSKPIGQLRVNGGFTPIRLADYVCGVDGDCICGDEFATDTLAEFKEAKQRYPNE